MLSVPTTLDDVDGFGYRMMRIVAELVVMFEQQHREKCGREMGSQNHSAVTASASVKTGRATCGKNPLREIGSLVVT